MTPAGLQERIDEHARRIGRGVLPWVAALYAGLAALGSASPRSGRHLLHAAALVVLAVPFGYLAGTDDPEQTVRSSSR